MTTTQTNKNKQKQSKSLRLWIGCWEDSMESGQNKSCEIHKLFFTATGRFGSFLLFTQPTDTKAHSKDRDTHSMQTKTITHSSPETSLFHRCSLNKKQKTFF